MSNFDKKGHGLPKYDDRKKRANELISHQYLREKWLRADHIVDQVYCDLCNGISKSDIIIKFANCAYDGQKKAIKERTAQDYIASAVDRLHYDMEAKQEDLRADLYGKLLTVYNDAMQANDRYSAIGALQTIMKLTGCMIQQPQTAIQINSDKEGGVTVNFGFSKEDSSDSQ